MARLNAEDRLRRLLALVPWVVAHDGPAVAEVCTRFGLTEAELIVDLDLVFLCGVHPFTPDALMDVLIEDGRVWIRYTGYFDRPLRLTPEEGLALVAAGTAVLAVRGADDAGPLARGLSKLAGVLGVDPADALDVELGAVATGVLDTLRTAAAEHRQVEIDYYAYGRDERTRRMVDPYEVYAADGQWYLSAYCHRAEAERRFRADRVRSVVLSDHVFVLPGRRRAHTVFEARADDRRVVLDLEARGRWVAESYPLEALEELDGGRCRVTLVASERAWLERLLLRLGRHVRVVEGADGVAEAAARRLLARYDAR